MVEPIIEEVAEQKAEETSPVFNSLEELQAWQQSKQPATEQPIVETKAEPAKSEEVVAEKPENKVVEQPQFDEVSYLKGIFGDEIDSVEKAKQAFTKQFEVPEDLKEQFEDAKFLRDNPQMREWNKLVVSGVDVTLAHQVTQLDASKLNPKDLLVIDLMFNNKLSKEEATAMVELQHKAAFGEEDDYEAKERLAATATLKMEAEKARARVVEFQQKMRLPEGERKAVEEKKNSEQLEKARRSQWQPEVKKIATEFTLSHKGDFGKDDLKTSVDFNLKLDAKEQEDYAKIVEAIVSNPNFSYSKENIENVKQLASAYYIAQNREGIFNKLVSKAIEERDAAWGAKVYGVPGKGKPQMPDNNLTERVIVKESRDANNQNWKW